MLDSVCIFIFSPNLYNWSYTVVLFYILSLSKSPSLSFFSAWWIYESDGFQFAHPLIPAGELQTSSNVAEP